MRLNVLWLILNLSLIPQGPAYNIRKTATKCLVAVQKSITPGAAKKALELSTNLGDYFGNTPPSQNIKAYNYDAPRSLKDADITQFRGLVVTQEQLNDIAQNGLDPTLSTQNRNSFGSLSDAIHYSSSEMLKRKYAAEKHIMIVVQVNPEWTNRLRVDPMQASTEYTPFWIPPQGIQSIMAIDPASAGRFTLEEITQPGN